jgi:predicted ATP-dependent endonuclease of OLD family
MEYPDKKTNQRYFKVHEDNEDRIELKKITKWTRFIDIPAVHEASEDIALKKGTPFTEILDLVVKSAFARSEGFAEVQERYKKEVDSFKDEVVDKLQTDLNQTLGRYAPGVAVQLTCEDESLEPPVPKATVKLSEDKFASPIDRTGHGLQRAFIISLLEQLQVQQAQEASQASDQTLIIGIEEPEIYQHPNRQRYLYELFEKLTTNHVSGNYGFQIVYSTHSPLFVTIGSLENVRRLYKYQDDASKPKVTGVRYKKFADIAKIYSQATANQEVENGSDFQHKLLTHMTPWMNEGFFAEKVVLVEGHDDYAAVLGTAMAMDARFEEKGISVIPSMGKTKLPRPASVFRGLEISTYVIWDSDKNQKNAEQRKANEKTNHTLLRLFNQEIEDYPHTVTKHFACFEFDLYHTLQAEIGKELCNSLLQEACELYGISQQKDVRKSPYVFKELMIEAEKRGKMAATLRQIVGNIAEIENE